MTCVTRDLQLQCRAVGPGVGQSPPPPTILADQLTPFQPRGEGRVCPPRYYLPHPQIFRPSYGLAMLDNGAKALMKSHFTFLQILKGQTKIQAQKWPIYQILFLFHPKKNSPKVQKNIGD